MSTLTLTLSPSNNSFEPEKLKNIPKILFSGTLYYILIERLIWRFLHTSPNYFTRILHSMDPLSWLAQTLSKCFAIVVFIIM